MEMKDIFERNNGKRCKFMFISGTIVGYNDVFLIAVVDSCCKCKFNAPSEATIVRYDLLNGNDNFMYVDEKDVIE